MGDEFQILIYEQGTVVGSIENRAIDIIPGVMATKFEGTWHATGARAVSMIRLLRNGQHIGAEEIFKPIQVISGDSITFTYTLTMGDLAALPHYEIPKFTSVEEAEAWLDQADLTKSVVTPRDHAPNGPCKICGDLDDHFGKPHSDVLNQAATRSFFDALTGLVRRKP